MDNQSINFDVFLCDSSQFSIIDLCNSRLLLTQSVSVNYNGTQEQVFPHSSEAEDEEDDQGNLWPECSLRGKRSAPEIRADHADQTKKSPQLGSGGPKMPTGQLQEVLQQADGSTHLERSRK